MPSLFARSDYSLNTRLLISFSILFFFFSGLTGIVLDRAFRNSIEAGAAERLQVQIYLLLAAAEEDAGEFYFLVDLQEPRFEQLNSGLYGFISRPSLGELWRSDSARTLTLEDPQVLRQPIDVGESIFTKSTNEEGEEFFMLSYGILWEDGIREYSFNVMENAAAYYSEIGNFRTSLWRWLGGVAVLLLLIQFFLMRWGLSPLKRMAADLKLIEAGKKNQLEGEYPVELRGVTDNLNLLIETERKQQARYRTTLGDLAHSLKTPLAVITGVLQSLSRTTKEPTSSDNEEQLQAATEQLERMNQIVSYQLQRAVQSGEGSSIGRQANLALAVEKVLGALHKVYHAKAIETETILDADVIFKGDERDLIEILGNVVDNAFKYGRQRVRVSVQNSSAETIELVIEDDGPGIPADQEDFVLQRGARADTLVQGQGIGLAVVTDIVNTYGGQISLARSDLGGAKVQIQFSALS